MKSGDTEALTALLYREARLLDAGQYEDWLALLTEDIQYRAPIQQDVAPGDVKYASRHRLSCLDEDFPVLSVRVAKIRTGLQQTENPRTRTVRLISNVEVLETEDPDACRVYSAFLLYRNLRQRDVEMLAGRRTDLWRRVRAGFRLADREILFAANVLPTKSLSLFY